MIIWLFRKEWKFVLPKEKRELTPGLVLENKGRDITMRTTVKVETYAKVNQYTDLWDQVNVTVTRKKNLIMVKVNDRLQTYYLKTPWIWIPRLK